MSGSPVQIIEATKYASCLDDRDRFYAILSLVPAEYKSTIKPDCTLNVNDVYKEFVLSHIKAGPRVDLFGMIPRSEASGPSWIPTLLKSRDVLLTPKRVVDLSMT